MNKILKLFVWEHVLEDYTSGIIFACAYSIEHARDLVMQSEGEPSYAGAKFDGMVYRAISDAPEVIEYPKSFVLWGGS